MMLRSRVLQRAYILMKEIGRRLPSLLPPRSKERTTARRRSAENHPAREDIFSEELQGSKRGLTAVLKRHSICRVYSSGPSAMPAAVIVPVQSLGIDGSAQDWWYAGKCRLLIYYC